MVEVLEQLECLFSASLEQRGDSYTIEIPCAELKQGTLRSGETYRVAVLPRSPQNSDTDTRQHHDGSASSADTTAHTQETPPVSKGDMREVTIETLGDQGDGIARIARGYVVIVPGDEVTVEITRTRDNVAFAQVRDDANTPDDSAAPEETVEDDTLGEEG